MKLPPKTPILLLFTAPFASAALTNYWPLNETAGTTAPTTVAGGTAAELFTGASWVTDPIRGQVLGFDGVDGYATAGSLPELGLDTSFTWAFWANSGQTANNNIMIGNRYPDAGWCKFTTAAFEYRDITPTFNQSIDYADFAVNTWVHHAVVKNGQLFTYYRNGVAIGNTWTSGVLPADTPFFFGGDTTNENWQGRLDDVATWNNALPPASIAGIYGNKYTPATAPVAETIPPLTNVLLADNFSGGDIDFSKWNVTTRGLEQNAEVGYDAPAVTGGAVVLGGTTSNQYWYGSSLESVDPIPSHLYTEVSVKRVSLSGSGTAYRSSVWIFGDTGHYLHLSQNVGENGWSFNARDDGGSGTLNPTGGGTNLQGMAALNTDLGSHDIKFRFMPTGISGGVNIEMRIDGVAQAVHGFTNFPANFTVILTGQARATGDTVSATFDDVNVVQPTIINQAPTFSQTSYLLPTATVGTAYTGTVADLASDPDGDTLTYSKVSGPTWLNVAANGTLTGTPTAGLTAANVLIRAIDSAGAEATSTLVFRVTDPATAATAPPFFGWWPLNETSGTLAADISGSGNHATVFNATLGGLADTGSVWAEDPETHQRVISFNGQDGVTTAGYAVVGNPPTTGNLPVMDAANSFTWSFWAKTEQATNNDIIIGNRYNATGGDFAPVQFTKFTGTAFEWYRDGTGQNIDYDDLVTDEWHHHVVVKDGASLFYYRDKQLLGGRAITNTLAAMPVFFGGGTNGVEAWQGYLSDVRFFNGALSEPGVTDVFNKRGVFAAVSPTFTASLYYQSKATVGAAFSRSVAPLASDPQNDALTFSKVSGPDWLAVSTAGVLSGTPDATSPVANVVVKAQDPSGNSTVATFIFRVENPDNPAPALFGSWPLDDGTGNTARDISGNSLNATISNPDVGGLGDTGGVWVQDPQHGTVLGLSGVDDASGATTGSQATVGDPPTSGTLPVLDAATGFTWSFWAKPLDAASSNDIVLGNRYNASGAEFAPTQFVKFTSRAFEWYYNGTVQNIDYPDFEPDVWTHHAVVKDGNSLFYYRNGVPAGQSTLTVYPTESLPLYFGGGFNGVENWHGYLSDIQTYTGALTESAIAALATPPSNNSSLKITSISIAANRAVTLNWNGEAGKTYIVYGSKTTSGWTQITETTSSSYTLQPGNPIFNPATETRLFFRVGEKAPN